MTKPLLTVEDLLLSNGPMLSSAVGKELEAAGLSPETARQRIARAKGNVRRLTALPFPKRAVILYHESTYNSPAYWDDLIRLAIESSPSYGSALAALKARGGIVPEPHFHIVSGSPLRQQGQVASSTVLERLIEARFLKRIAVDGIGPCIALHGNGHLYHASSAQLLARLITERVVLLAVRDWARKLGMASYDKIALRDDAIPQYGTFAWDLCGPSYLRPMTRRDAAGKPSPGFLVCDVLTANAIDAAAIAALIRKCTVLSGLRNLPPMLPMLLADSFTREVFNLGRSHGILMTTPLNLFGREVATGLASLLKSLTRAAEVATQNPEIITELFDKLGHIEGAAANLRGALFEMILGHAVHAREGDPIEIGRRLRDPATGESAEIDVLRVKERQGVWAYEGKGHQPTEVVDLDTVKEWVTKRVALIHRIMRAEQRFQGCSFAFEFWTCGTFTTEARAYADQVSARTRRYSIALKDGAEVRSYVAQIKSASVMQTLDQHYFNHPLARTDRKYDLPADVNGGELAPAIESGDLEESLDASADPRLPSLA
jgi:hypothetical protein